MTSSSPVWSLQSPAKLNWTLEVLGQRDDGFHALRSWLVAVGWFDTLSLQVVEGEGGLRIEGPAADGIPSDGRNLVLQAESMWRAAGGEAPTLAWHLHKRIPVAAGLGGGSGNAAAALLLLQQVAVKSAAVALQELAARLGSDVSFFLQQQAACCMGGRGEMMLASCDPPTASMVLAVPGFPVPTAEVYAALDAPVWTEVAEEEGLPPDSLPLEPGRNDLFAAASKVAPQLEAFADALCQVAAFHLSGSGGTFFCKAPDPRSAEEIAARVKEVCQHVRVVPLLAGPVIAIP